MAFPSVTYTFTNGSTADATQVNQNFTDLINGLSDGTKSLSISALTAASTGTFSGNMVLGLSSSNTLTFNGSVASTIPVGTNTTYDLGGATLGFRSLYLGGSSTFTTRILGGTLSGSYTLTLPTSAGTTGQFPKTNGSGVLTFSYPDTTVGIQSTTYAATGAETVIPCNGTSAGFTVTLPAAASFPGKRFQIYRTDNTIANTVTIGRTGSDTFSDLTTGLTSTTLNTQGETIDVVSDGTSIWYVLDRKIPSVFVAYTGTFGATTAPPTLSGTSTTVWYWKRDGGNMWINFLYTQTSVAGATNGTGTYTFSLPTGVTADTAKIATTGGTYNTPFGVVWILNNATLFSGWVQFGSTTTLQLVVGNNGNAYQAVSATYCNVTGVTTQNYAFMAGPIPITGWNS